MTYKKIDKNQNQVVKELRELGFSVPLTHTIGKGFPDFVVGFAGYNLLVELKSNGGKLTKDEKDFHKSFTGTVVTCFNTQDVIDELVKYIETSCVKKEQTEETLLRLKLLLQDVVIE